MVQLVRDIRHPRVQRLITTARHKLQVPRHSGHLKATLGVATPLESLVVLSPAIGLHLDSSLNPPDQVSLVALPLEDRESPIVLVEAQCWVGIDALVTAQLLEVHAIHLEEPHTPHCAIAIGERLRCTTILAMYLLGDLNKLRRE